ncbi:MAG: nickel transporter [SAR86 cluster bacterium]|uniref:Nickel transporter n=1 Tax=SAR86 cluster bacterium TaxID=2030880 RepID=A0A2A5BB50_9GAMM|nr:MAG: nickel transporter [SAR86 cluster bacterium]
MIDRRFFSIFKTSIFLLCTVLINTSAYGHFQMLYTPEMALTRGQATQFTMVFTHPVHGGPHMDMGLPEQFYVVSQRGGEAQPKRTDLLEYVQPIDWLSSQGATQAYTASLPRSVTRSLGDYVFVLQPAPYYESNEDKYIQQFTRVMLNIGGVPGNWSEPMGLPAEIQPLNKPYANWTGGLFRGIVLADGEPVPNAEIEIEYMNHMPDQDANRFSEAAEVELPQDSYGTMTIYANDRGEFSIGLPRAGWWGICALAIGADTEHNGKSLSQDAVLWLQVKDMK